MKKTGIVASALVAVIVGTLVGVYFWQNRTLTSLARQHALLKQQVETLQSQYIAAQVAADISTSSWKTYCDQFTPFCFNYPGSWTLTDGSLNLPGDQRDFVSLVNPDKAVHITYANPLVKDGGSLSARIVKADYITVDTVKVAVLGIIPVSSGIYQPGYIMLNNQWAIDNKPGNDAVLVSGSINPRFDIGAYHAIQLYGYPTAKMTSFAQAAAWFDSIDGKTVAKILESYAGK
jgi:hypothetical protein